MRAISGEVSHGRPRSHALGRPGATFEIDSAPATPRCVVLGPDHFDWDGDHLLRPVGATR